MTGIDPIIIEHNIDTWPDATPIWKKQRLVHPYKSSNIKAEIKKVKLVNKIIKTMLERTVNKKTN